METKRFDCVEMKQKGAEKVQKQTSAMTKEEEVIFWREGTEDLRRTQRETIEGTGGGRKKKKKIASSSSQL
jgi:hypothetical protein